MANECKLPALGENVESGDVVNILVREGDQIEPNQGVLELETDKAVIEVPCPFGGKVSKVHVKKGETVKVGQTLLTVEGDGQAAEDTPKPAAPAKEEEAKEPEPVAEKVKASPAPKKPAAEKPAAERPAPVSEPTAPLPAGPAARRVARELGVDLAQVAGSGKRGRITIDDVKAAGEGAGSAAGAPEPVTPPGEPGQDQYGPVRREKMPRIRRAIAEQMVRSVSTIPHVTNFDDADVTDLEQLRKSVPPGYLGEGVKLTAMPFVLRAVALSLQQHPAVNASIDDENGQIVYKGYVNLGIAVDTPRGLVVPNIRGAERMGIARLARELGYIAQRARNADFAIEDLRGGTFTVSNLGAIGGAYSTPIINHPEVAILLLGRSRWQPAVREGQIVPRLMMPLSLSYDHRLIDGAAAGRFLNSVIDYLQSPAKLLLAG
ncbi:MAG: dihydrolipoamide acetyltransferase family protein [Thermoguttaceae bacterium]|jgi:pyruvate/2-oxoglutarate dehydrogenase complex dihydrolipoamide acyltransferase (E2) component|nr:dihydrolipoamide acetyltransferase family protein [Thermoguttaceae bacterium]